MKSAVILALVAGIFYPSECFSGNAACKRNVTWLEAEECCRHHNQTLPLLPKQLRGTTGFQYNVTGIWTVLTRRILDSWTWVDGSTDTILSDLGSGLDCAYYNHMTGHLEAGRCDEKLVTGSICEVTDCRQCLEMKPILHQVCAWHNYKCYIYLCSEYTWHQARKHCQGRGWELATIKHNQTKHILGSGTFGCSRFWVGLRRDDWVDGPGFHPSRIYDYLELSQPTGRCSALMISGERTILKATSCSATKPFICTEDEEPHINNGTDSATSVVTTVREIQRESPINYGTILGVLGGSIAFILFTVITVVLCRRTKKRAPSRESGTIKDAEQSGYLMTDAHLAHEDHIDPSRQDFHFQWTAGRGYGRETREQIVDNSCTETPESLEKLESNLGSKNEVSHELEGTPLPIITCNSDGLLSFSETNLISVLQKRDAENLSVVVCSIIGSSFTGKSFLMNYLLRYLRALETGSISNWVELERSGLSGFPWNQLQLNCKPGIYMWSHPFVVQVNGEKVAILLADTKDIFGEDCTKEMSAAFVTAAAHLSSILLYNIQGMIREEELQNIKKWLGSDINERTPGTTNDIAKRLIFIVRDWIDAAHYPYGAGGGTAFLKDKIKQGENDTASILAHRSFILSAFEKLDCFLMPHPGIKAAQVDPDDNFTGKWADLEKNFRRKLKKMAPFIFDNIGEQLKVIDTEEVSGTSYLAFLQKYFQNG